MKNRATKFISLALCTVVLFAAVGTSVFALTGEGKEGEDENQETTINASAEAETSKDETVYVLAGADGTVQKIIVSDWIKMLWPRIRLRIKPSFQTSKISRVTKALPLAATIAAYGMPKETTSIIREISKKSFLSKCPSVTPWMGKPLLLRHLPVKAAM